ncbi:hypothetical protein APHAL10511_000246 [Amanita phalloides]|nr:hypothetical protein APHAL10511_000246 [Amanita phalloides]
MFGTTDGYTTQVGKTEHKMVKRLYSRASKANTAKSITKHQGRGRALHKMAQCNKAISENLDLDDQHPCKHHKIQKDPMLLFEDKDKLPFANPNGHYHIAGNEKMKLNVYQWPGKELSDRNTAYKNWYPKLLDHLLARLKDVDLYDSDEPTFSDAE